MPQAANPADRTRRQRRDPELLAGHVGDDRPVGSGIQKEVKLTGLIAGQIKVDVAVDVSYRNLQRRAILRGQRRASAQTEEQRNKDKISHCKLAYQQAGLLLEAAPARLRIFEAGYGGG